MNIENVLANVSRTAKYRLHARIRNIELLQISSSGLLQLPLQNASRELRCLTCFIFEVFNLEML